MKDLTQGSIPKHIVVMAVPMAIGMLAQTLYYLVDLYFVGRLGAAALAGVSSAGNAMFLIIGLTSVLGVGTGALVAHAVGAKDQEEASLIFNQSLVLSAIAGLLTLALGYLLARTYMQSLAADAAVYTEGMRYLHWFIPGLALQFAAVSISAALRGAGVVTPVMAIQLVAVLFNTILSPILITGWGTGYPMGVAGAALASTISVVLATILLWWYFFRSDRYVTINASQLPLRWRPCKRILGIGIPTGMEFVLMFTYIAMIHWALKSLGGVEQAGFGVGSRVMQSILLPGMAIAFAVPAVAGQNFGAKLSDRVRATARWGLGLNALLMLPLTLICLSVPEFLVGIFANDTAVLYSASVFLSTISLNFVFSGAIFVASGMFQALGNTWPGVISFATRLVTFGIPLIWLTEQETLSAQQIWYLSVITVMFQALLSWWLVGIEQNKRLAFGGVEE